jgi:hypothetical protein
MKVRRKEGRKGRQGRQAGFKGREAARQESTQAGRQAGRKGRQGRKEGWFRDRWQGSGKSKNKMGNQIAK